MSGFVDSIFDIDSFIHYIVLVNFVAVFVFWSTANALFVYLVGVADLQSDLSPYLLP